MVLNDGTDWQPEAGDIARWKELYPAVNVEQELRAMEGWCDANPKKRKTPSGVKRFVNSWLSRCQDRGGSSPAEAADGLILKTRAMSTENELTHNFVDDPEVREFFLQKYGECFERGRVITRD